VSDFAEHAVNGRKHFTESSLSELPHSRNKNDDRNQLVQNGG
jgi:hypothetical protein